MKSSPVETARGWLERQLSELGGLRNAGNRAPEFKAWRQNTLTVIQRIWPGDEKRCDRFRRIPFRPPGTKADTRAVRECYERGCGEAGVLLRQFLGELTLVGLDGPIDAAVEVSEPKNENEKESQKETSGAPSLNPVAQWLQRLPSRAPAPRGGGNGKKKAAPSESLHTADDFLSTSPIFNPPETAPPMTVTPEPEPMVEAARPIPPAPAATVSAKPTPASAKPEPAPPVKPTSATTPPPPTVNAPAAAPKPNAPAAEMPAQSAPAAKAPSPSPAMPAKPASVEPVASAPAVTAAMPPAMSIVPAPAETAPASMQFNSEAAREIAMVAAALEFLDVPPARRRPLAAALFELSHAIDGVSPEWADLRRGVNVVMEHPAVARRVLPHVLPFINKAA